MLRKLRVVSPYTFAAALILAASSPAQAALRYRLTLLAHPPDHEFTTASAISEDGRIGGTAGGFGGMALYWASADAPAEGIPGVGINCKGVGGPDCITVLDVNSSGVAVGISMEGSYAFRWQSGTDLEILPGSSGCCPRAEAINDKGAIVGQIVVDGGNSMAAMWVDNDVHNLGTAPGHSQSIAYDISDAGHIVGASNNRAARWVNGKGETLTGLEDNDSGANGVNNNGDIVGQMTVGSLGRPFFWRSHVLTELPSLGGAHGRADAINDDGIIVGMSFVGALRHAVLWRKGEPIDLNSRVVNLPSATLLAHAHDINNAGQLVGLAVTHKPTFSLEGAFFLDPIPPADVNADGSVNIDDLIQVILNWGECPPDVLCDADVIEDGQVNVDDLIGVILAWGL